MTRSPAPAPPPRPARRTTAALLRAVGALAALAVTVGGLPWLLWQATTALAPSGWDALHHLFSRQDTSSVALLAVCVIGWLAWASFILSLLLELPAQLRGVRAPRLPGLQISQRAAAVLVGSLLVLLPTGTALAAASPVEAAPRATTSVSTPVQPDAVQETSGAAAGQHTHDQVDHASAPSGAHDRYTVRDTRPAESLWSIAERLYGDGQLYTHIAHANEGKVMSDGSTFRADAPIQPGWVLALPAGVPHEASESGGLHTQSAASRPQAEQHTVARGESLSQIALEETGDAGNWPQLYAASRGAQPDGLPRISDPDRIFPRQIITVPAAATPPDGDRPADQAPSQPRPDERPGHDGGQQTPDDRDGSGQGGAGSGGTGHGGSASATPEATHTPSAEPPTTPPATTAPSERPAEQAPASPSAEAEDTRRPSASSPATATPNASRPASPSHGAQHETPAAGDTDTDPTSASAVSARTAVGALALLAAALTGTLAVRRLRQRQRRKPGQTLPPTTAAPQETVLEQVASDGGDGVLRLHAALAQLAAAHGATPPPLRAARITADGVQVLPDDIEAAPKDPFTQARAGWWHLPDTVPLPEHENATMPYPALVTLGSDTDGSLVMAHLPAFQVLLVDGEPEQRAEVLACLATELTIGPAADHVEVIGCGLGAMGADVTAFGVQYLPDPRIAAGEFASRVLEAHQERDDAPTMPYVVLCAGELDDDTAWAFAETLDKARGLVPAVLVMPATAAAVFPDAETIDASSDEPQRVDAIGCDIVLQRLDAGSIAALAAAYRQSTEPPVQAEGVWEHVPPEAIALPDPAPAVQAVPDQPTAQTDMPAGDTATPEQDQDYAATAGREPVIFQALLGAATSPGTVPLRALHGGDATSAAGRDSEPVDTGEAVKRPGPKFFTPSSYAILAAERVAPIRETEDDRALAEASGDEAAPRLRVLGRVEMEGVELEPRLTELTAHLLLLPGSSADVLCEDMGDNEPWSATTLNARMRGLRNKLGADSDGEPYIPQRKVKTSPYAVSGLVRCDWTEFDRLAELGLSRGTNGLHYLERALGLVDGVPLGEHPASWMVPLRTYMQNRITDVAHTVATHRMEDGPHQDFPSARKACAIGLNADPLAEVVHRSLMKVESQAGNRTGLRAAIARWQGTTRHLDREKVDPTTQRLVDKLLAAS